MNSFFASVEQEMNPALRGKPVAVVPMLADTTCCIAASYEAKARGVKTGTLVREAKRLCPGIRLVEANHEHYIRYHHRIIDAVESCLPIEAVCSIDEIACRLTGSQTKVENARALAAKIKATLRKEVGVAVLCSIGAAPNRYLAKIAADMQKPDGFTVIRPSDLPSALYPLKLRDLVGIGPQTEARLLKQGISSLEMLCSLSPQGMRQAWGGVVGEELYHLLRGKDIRAKKSEQKSIGHSHVLPPDLRNEHGALTVLKKLTTKTALRLRKEGFWAGRLEIFVRFRGQDSWSAGASFDETQDTLVFLNAVKEFWKELPAGSIFAVGVTLSRLTPASRHAPTLFDDPKRERLTQALDRLNERFGKDAVHFGATHDALKLAPLRIAFTRIPDLSET
jgi:DNA polymerase-4